MNEHSYLLYTLIFLLAAVVAVPLFRRFGLSSVLGYLAAGVAIGPDALGIIKDPASALGAAEMGVVMLLFVIGLELSPSRLWVMRRPVFGAGGLQVALTALLLTGLILPMAAGWKSALVIGMGLALSSTAVGVQLLAERKELSSPHGRTAFGILLFQDLIAIPLLAAIPLLGVIKGTESPIPNFIAVLKALGAIAAVVVGGRYLLRHVFRIVARTQLVEVFTATALLVVVGNALLMQWVGLSMGLGAFLAGVLLADSEFRHELESHIEPFKGLLLGLFFIAVGMSIDINLIVHQPYWIAAGVLALLLAKTIVLLAVGRWTGLALRNIILLAMLLSMGGEFAFVVFNEALRARLIDAELRAVLTAIVGCSMALTPLALLALQRFLPLLDKPDKREFDAIDEEYPRVIIAGFGRVGQIVARVLRAQRIAFTALENSAEQIEFSRRFGNKIYYGDPARPELLRAVHAERAEVFVVATDDPDANIRTARIVKRLYPHLKVLARARNRQHAFRLMDLGVDGLVRETFHSSLVLAQHVLESLGVATDTAGERIERFRMHDEALLRQQYLVYDDDAALVASTQEALRELEHLFEADVPAPSEMGGGNPSGEIR